MSPHFFGSCTRSSYRCVDMLQTTTLNIINIMNFHGKIFLNGKRVNFISNEAKLYVNNINSNSNWKCFQSQCEHAHLCSIAFLSDKILHRCSGDTSYVHYHQHEHPIFSWNSISISYTWFCLMGIRQANPIKSILSSISASTLHTLFFSPFSHTRPWFNIDILSLIIKTNSPWKLIVQRIFAQHLFFFSVSLVHTLALCLADMKKKTALELNY